jgi:UDP-N-acetylglucosamine 2-epimerase (non-hydrolysing)
MIKVLTIFGTRPEAIKLAPVIRSLEKYPEQFTSMVCVTAQHREMLDQVLNIFHITPHYDLNIMRPKQSLTEVTSGILQNIEGVLQAEKPNLVLVQGDTNTTFAAGLAAFYQKIKIGHVEAGLRTFDKYQPFPEEMNRRLTSVLADYHFAPTYRARENLLREGVDEHSIVVTGNTGIDALFMILAQLQEAPPHHSWCNRFLPNLDGTRLIVVTTHRRENFGAIFAEICKALREIVLKNPDVMVIYPVHPNPHIQSCAKKFLKGCERIKLVEPLGYVSFVELLDKASLILTDSGGIQEEAPYLGKPVLVLRNVTERVEALEAGTARLVGTKAPLIIEAVQQLLDSQSVYPKINQLKNPFGDGKASERIIAHILESFS